MGSEEEEEYVEDEVAHAEKLTKEEWVVEDQCKWTIFEDLEDELRYHKKRSRALGHFVRAFLTLRKECEGLHEAGASLQDSYDRLFEENKEAIGDLAYWRELAGDTAVDEETSVRSSIAPSEPAESQSSTEIVQNEQEAMPNEAPPELKRKSLPGASASDLEPLQTREAWHTQAANSALSSVREKATCWRKVAEQRGEYNALCSPRAAISQRRPKRRSSDPGSLSAATAVGSFTGNNNGRDGALPRSQGAPSSPKPDGVAFQQVQAPGLATHATLASSPRHEVVHEQDRAAGEQPVTLNQHEQEKREWSGSPRQISIPPSPHREKKTSSREASGEEELQMEKLAGTSNTETTLAAPTTNLVRDVATPSRASAPARRLSGPRTPMRRKVTLQFLGLIVCLLAVTWALDSLKVVSVRRMSCTLATAAENALGRPRAPALVTSLQEQLCRGWEAERQPYEPAQPDDDMRDDKFDKEIKDDKDDKDNKDDDANNEKSKEDDSADEQAAWSSVKGLPRWLPPCAGMSPTMCILSR